MPKKHTARQGNSGGGGKRGLHSRKVAPTAIDDLYAVGRTATRALAVFKGASNLLNAETKTIDVTVSGNVTSTATCAWLSGTAQGDGQDDRDGSSLKIKKMIVRYRAAAAAAGSPAAALRVVLFVDTASDGALPSPAAVLDSGMAGHPNVATSFGRYQILYDKVHGLNPNGLASQSEVIDLSQVRDMHVVQLGSSNSVANARAAHVFVLTQSTEATNTPSILLTSRMLFVDN